MVVLGGAFVAGVFVGVPDCPGLPTQAEATTAKIRRTATTTSLPFTATTGKSLLKRPGLKSFPYLRKLLTHPEPPKDRLSKEKT
ncbi:hypothetical protein BD01_0773 [Thermococcus nautili]|uniref:Uncharacterized protein n=1 Tax=Thermococcus nautili TaxID=195522 RepID=W8P4K7_9EURY|nr:hypothetical protein BD01_0773 [Thermococcus nautili]